MIVRRLDIADVVEIVPPRHGDGRGHFSEVWKESYLEQAGIQVRFIQDNQSYSAPRGVLRGLHYQAPPFVQAKLVRVLRGAIFDVAVDLRRGSPSFGRWVGLTLSAKAGNQLFVPGGFAHGFVTLEPDCEVLYKVSAPYSPEHDRAIRFDDPDIAIDWPLAGAEMTLSAKDEAAPLLSGADLPFTYGEA